MTKLVKITSKTKHSCSHCAMSQLCLPLGVNREDLDKIENLVGNSKPLHSGDVIFGQGSLFNKIYAVKTGTVKSVHLDETGNEHVVGFHLPGELVGLDGIYPESYPNTVSALDTTVMCELDYTQLSDLCTEIPSLQKQMFRLLSRDIYASHRAQSENVEHTAEQKLANFLINLSARYETRGYSSTRFPLTMPRQDIANHLGMAPETVSRLIKRFKDLGLLSIENRDMKLLDVKKLKQIVE